MVISHCHRKEQGNQTLEKDNQVERVPCTTFKNLDSKNNVAYYF
jgi:hypothetical protein